MKPSASSRVDAGEHYVAYLRWDVREDWKRLGGPQTSDRRLHPFAYGSNWRHFPAVVRPGAVLWIVAAPLYRERGRSAIYRLPPTLIARLAVARVTPGNKSIPTQAKLEIDKPRQPALPHNYAWVAEAEGDSSTYFPINNAFHALTDIEFVNQRGQRTRIPKRPARFDRHHPYQHVPQYLQSLRRLAPGSEGVLETLASSMREGRTVFLSYARDERFPGGSGFVARLVDELRREASHRGLTSHRFHSLAAASVSNPNSCGNS